MKINNENIQAIKDYICSKVFRKHCDIKTYSGLNIGIVYHKIELPKINCNLNFWLDYDDQYGLSIQIDLCNGDRNYYFGFSGLYYYDYEKEKQTTDEKVNYDIQNELRETIQNCIDDELLVYLIETENLKRELNNDN